MQNKLLYKCKSMQQWLHLSWSQAHTSALRQRWAVISKTQMKNAKKAFNREQMKNDAKDKKEVCSLTVLTACLLL